MMDEFSCLVSDVVVRLFGCLVVWVVVPGTPALHGFSEGLPNRKQEQGFLTLAFGVLRRSGDKSLVRRRGSYVG